MRFRHIFIIIVFCSVVADAVFADPVLKLSFEEKSGSQVTDLISKQIVAEVVGNNVEFAIPGPRAPRYPKMGDNNHAMRFSASDTHLVFGMSSNNQLRDAPAVTLSIWIRPGQNRDGQVNIVTCFAGDESSVSLVLISESVGRSIVIGGRSGEGDRFAGARAPLHGDGWMHVVGVLDYKHREARLYVNGNLESVNAISAAKWANTKYSPPANSDPITVASMAGSRFFRGDVDELAIYPYALDDPNGDGGRSDSQITIYGEPDVLKYPPQPLQRIKYNHPGLTVELGAGLMARTSPAITDYDNDGDADLILFCTDKPWNGTYLYRNTDGTGQAIFEPPIRLCDAPKQAQASYVNGQLRVLEPGREYKDFNSRLVELPVELNLPANIHDQDRIRANQWRYIDYDGDGVSDIVVGVGDWSEYGWQDAFNEQGEWTNGPLHGYVYLIRNRGSDTSPDYSHPLKIKAGGAPIDVAGMPSPCFADYDGDGDLDLICGEFIDGFTYYENTGTRADPLYAKGRRILLEGQPLRIETCMPVPIVYDWNRDGWPDLITSTETGHVFLIQHTGELRNGMPVFAKPEAFRQKAEDLKFGVLVTPVSYDWNGDGRDDLICGNAAGYIGFIENLDGGDPPKWAAPVLLEADGHVIRIQAGDNGSIQGPAESKWGYTSLSVADWDLDGLPDLIVNSIWGKVIWYRNIGTRTKPKLDVAQPVCVEWPARPDKPAWTWWEPDDRELVTQWRTTPAVLDYTGDGLPDLVMLDHEGYLALFERQRVDGELKLMPPRRIFYSDGPSAFNQIHRPSFNGPGLLQLNDGWAGRSGRRKLAFTDWDGDGRLDLLVNSTNIDILRGLSQEDGRTVFRQSGTLGARSIAGHTTSPAIVNWDNDPYPDLLIGAEDGHFYYLRNPIVSVEGRP